MTQFKILILVAAVLIIQIQGISLAKCKKPSGIAGDVKVNGCKKRTCTAVTARKGVWIDGPSM